MELASIGGNVVVYKQGDDGEVQNLKKIVIQHHRQKHLEMNYVSCLSFISGIKK
jgi:hypothetical protein